MNLKPHLPYLGLFTAFLVAFFWGLNIDILGHDYFYFFPKLLDGKWHFLRQGLAMFEYTPHFCGGFPEYANPQSMYYSLPQFLVLFLDLWLATQLTILISMVIAYFGWYRVGRDLIKLNLPFAHLLALIISAHGFHFMHMIPGHIVFHSMPMVGWMLWLLFDRSDRSLRELIRKAAWFALISAYILYSGGYMVMVMFAFAVLALLPFELIWQTPVVPRIRSLMRNGVACGLGALLICASKLVVTFSFLRYFPRVFPFERLWDDTHIIFYIFRALFGFPQTNDFYWEFGMGKWGAIHEYSMLISPIVLIGLIAALYLLIKHWSAVSKKKVVVTSVVFIVWMMFFMQLMQGYGWMVTPLENVPVFKGLHVNMRWMYSFSFVPIILSVWALQSIWNKNGIVVAASVLTIVAFVGGYWGILHGKTLPRTMPYNEILQAFEQTEGYMDLDVDEAFDMRGLGHSGFIPLIFGGNHIYCHEPMLLGSSELPDSIVVAPVNQEIDGAFNLYNPACMVYPEQNGCESGDRIALTDAENLERFRTGKKTTWKKSGLQVVANWISLLTLIALPFALWKKRD